MQDPAPLAYVGCRTSRERNARGDGINVFRTDPAGGPWTHIQRVGDLFNPSYLALAPDRRTLYAVHGDASEVSAFRVDAASGRLAFLNRASTHGMNPVHLAVDRSGRFLVIANHVTTPQFASGLAVLSLAPDGALGELTDLVALQGKLGPHKVEQPFPKPHQVQFDPTGRFIIVPDKGRDVVEAYRLDAAGKLSVMAGAPRAQEGAGPRHVAFTADARFAYVLNELNSTIEAFRFDPETGALAPFQVLPSLPDTFTGDSRASEIEVSAGGRFVYASNRGADTIGVFAIEAASGRLSPRGWQATGGKTPRFFALAPGGRILFAANEDSDSITALQIDPGSGALGAAVQVAQTGSPTCIVF
ncbi:MAG TPA: lactonase family protein [Phenylobacterium sp.]|nr:lactonase family protein [Phenylobacterium sp.]